MICRLSPRVQLLRGLRSALLGAAIALIAACAPAQRGSEGQAPAGPALWTVTDADSTVYLFGTVHILPPELNWRTQRIDDALASSETVWFETPTQDEAAAEIQAQVRRLGFNPPGVALSDRLDPEEAFRLRRVARSLDLDPALLEPARPWLASLQISLAFIKKQGHSAEAGVDRVLEAEAERAGKDIRYFETAEQQIRFFADLPEPVQIGFLSATLRQIEEEDDLVDEMDAAWARGDVIALETLLTGMIREAGPEVYDALIAQRNARWAQEIERFMEGEGTAFVAVGAAHLAGRDSVAEILRRRGYDVDGPPTELSLRDGS